jgi:hypothetical protein
MAPDPRCRAARTISKEYACCRGNRKQVDVPRENSIVYIELNAFQHFQKRNRSSLLDPNVKEFVLRSAVTKAWKKNGKDCIVLVTTNVCLLWLYFLCNKGSRELCISLGQVTVGKGARTISKEYACCRGNRIQVDVPWENYMCGMVLIL